MRPRGFTLTEVMIILVILAVLTGLAVPNYFHQVEISRSNEAKAVLIVLDNAQRVYYATGDSTYFPTDTESESDLSVINAALSTDINPTYYKITVYGSTATLCSDCYSAMVTRIDHINKTFTIKRGANGWSPDGCIQEDGDYIDSPPSFTPPPAARKDGPCYD